MLIKAQSKPWKSETVFTRVLSVIVFLACLSSPLQGQDVVSQWNEVMLATISSQNPFAQARFAAITQVAVFEAVNAITRKYEPYVGTIFAPDDASQEAAVISAAYRVLWTYFPSNAINLDSLRASSLALIPDGPAKVNGIAAGEAAAAAMIQRRANDGSGTPLPYTPLTGPGFWQPTPPAFGQAALLHWAKVIPFGIVSADQFRSNPPPTLTSGKYWRDYDEVKAVGGVNSTARPQDRADVARFYAAASAAQVWNRAANQIAATRQKSLTDKARILALLNMAINDGLISSIETKYFYQFWRPVTAIRAGDTDGNSQTEADGDFAPFVTTPSFPSYPSAHASASYAAREILERSGANGPQFVTLAYPAVAGVILQYSSLQRITEDIDDARVYGGIHFRFDQDAGAWQGCHIGEYVYQHNLRRRPGGHQNED
jgi:hypothetical protein